MCNCTRTSSSRYGVSFSTPSLPSASPNTAALVPRQSYNAHESIITCSRSGAEPILLVQESIHHTTTSNFPTSSHRGPFLDLRKANTTTTREHAAYTFHVTVKWMIIQLLTKKDQKFQFMMMGHAFTAKG